MGALNQSLFLWIHHFAGRYVFLDVAGIFFANYLAYLMVVAFLVLAYYEVGWRKKFYVLCEGALAVILARGILTELIRLFYYHPRPFVVFNFTPLIAESGSSFPSGHMMLFFALAVTVWYVNRAWGVWFLALSAVIGVARIYVGVHWPLDILGGAVIGLASGIFIHWLLREPRETLYR